MIIDYEYWPDGEVIEAPKPKEPRPKSSLKNFNFQQTHIFNTEEEAVDFVNHQNDPNIVVTP